MTFTINRLVGNRAVIAGNDKFGTHGNIVVDTQQWDELNVTTSVKQAQADFDEAVNEFFGPLLEAAEKVGQKLTKPEDPMTYVVIEEGTEGVAPKARHLTRLSHDSVLIRLVESGNTDRLMWVGDQLEVLEADTELPFGDGSDDSAYAGADADAMFTDTDGGPADDAS